MNKELLSQQAKQRKARVVTEPPPSIGQATPLNFEVASDWQRLHPSMWLSCWSRMDDNARMIVTSERIFLCGDKRAQEILSSERELRLRGMRLETTDPAEMKNLDQLLQSIDGEVATLCLKSKLRGHLLIRAALLANMNGMPIMGVSLRQANGKFAPRWVDLAKVFGLTRSEHRIVCLLLNGSSAEVIAAELALSINTVRTHVSHAYEKLGITCREELWRRLGPYRVN